ncbi:MAG: hypothetical protein K0S39_5204 [Paenibacillus sp.]|jgi:hypothetical protein|nr:hypothetical protein [Paenibacillus sp.]
MNSPVTGIFVEVVILCVFWKQINMNPIKC